MNPDSHITRSFVRSRLPWLVFIAALVFYCATLNRWVSLLNIGNVGRVAGWMWQSDLASPAYWLVTLPVKGIVVAVMTGCGLHHALSARMGS